MSSVLVNSTSGLEAALASAQAGETILLAPGTYTGTSFYNVNPSGTVTIASEYASSQAVLQNFEVSGSSNLVFSNLEMSTVGSTDPYYGFRVYNSTNIQFNSDYFHGAVGVDPNTGVTGLLAEYDTNVSITNSTFNYLLTGVAELNNNGFTFSGNSMQYLAADGIDNAGSSNVQILNNTETNAVLDTVGLHPDMIQFWTAGTTTDASNITVSGNTFVRGTGAAIQGIFLGNEIGLAYLNVSITNNVVTGGLYNGIAVGDAIDPTISGNTVQPYTDQQSWIVLNGLTGGTIDYNAVTQFLESGDTNLVQVGNTIISAIPVPTTSDPVSPPPPPPAPALTASTPPPPTAPTAPSGLSLDASTNSGSTGDTLTNVAQVQIDGVAQGGATVTLFDGATAIGTSVANASTGAFSIVATTPLSNGAHSLTATATSSGGVSQASAPLSVTIDTLPATAALTHGTQAFTSSGEVVTLTGTASAGVAGVPVTVSILQDGQSIGTVTPTNGAWSFTANVTNTLHTYTLQTNDAAGNIGSGSNALLLGTNTINTIIGSAGANLIIGGGGADILTGGSGSNTFIYNSPNDAPTNGNKVETITNWISGTDHIDLSAFGPLSFGGQTTHTAPNTVDWFNSGGNTYVVAETNGHGRPDLMIELIGVHQLASSDFLLV